MPVPSALLIMDDPGKQDRSTPSAYDMAHKEPEDERAEGFARARAGDATVTGQAIKAAYEASRNGNPKAYADAFEGAVKSMLGDEIHRILNERDAQKGY